MEKGEVRWYAFAKPDKTRPVLILTRNSAIRYLNAITVAPITTTIRSVPSEVRLSIEDGMPKDCAVNLHNLQTVSKTRIGAWITALSEERLTEVAQAIQFALGLDFTT